MDLPKVGRLPLSRWGKRVAAVISPFLIMFGTHVILTEVLLRSSFATLEAAGQMKAVTIPTFIAAVLFALLVAVMVDLNRKLQNQSTKIGLALAISFCIPYLFFHIFFGLPLFVTLWSVVLYLFAITLASYLFSMLWG